MATVIARALIDKVADWLMQQSLAETDIEAVVAGCCQRLSAAGVPLARAFFAFNVLHPLRRAIGITWRHGEGSSLSGYLHEESGMSEVYRRSPHFFMRQQGLDLLRVGLDCNQRQYDFPILEDLRQEGMTDYIAFLVGYPGEVGEGMAGSWATDHGSGFAPDQIEALIRIQSRLAVACKMALKTELMRNLASTYLGTSAGRHVLSGQIKRGDGQSITAPIWYADIRGSTALADTLERQQYIDTLNGFFDTTGQPVQEHGGEVLSFIGDSLLAIFPAGGEADEAELALACERALAAAFAARERIAAFNDERREAGRPPIGYGISLHVGEVMYGNVGIAERLTFSAFGSAVNEVTRLDQLTKRLKEPVLASDAFADRLERPWRSLGLHNLRGIDRPMPVFAPGDERVTVAGPGRRKAASVRSA